MQKKRDYKDFIQAFETYRKTHPEFSFQKCLNRFLNASSPQNKSTISEKTAV